MTDPRDPVTPLTAHDAHELDRLERGRPLTDAEIACYLADHQTPLRHATAHVGDEIADQLRDRLATLDAARQSDGAEAGLRETAQADLRAKIAALRQIDSVRLDNVDLRRTIEPSTLLVRDDVLAALQDAPVSIDPERLAKALHYVQAMADEHGDPTAPPDESCVIDAANIVREYDRLSHPVSTEDSHAD